jgi:hypothetical protein
MRLAVPCLTHGSPAVTGRRSPGCSGEWNWPTVNWDFIETRDCWRPRVPGWGGPASSNSRHRAASISDGLQPASWPGGATLPVRWLRCPRSGGAAFVSYLSGGFSSGLPDGPAWRSPFAFRFNGVLQRRQVVPVSASPQGSDRNAESCLVFSLRPECLFASRCRRTCPAFGKSDLGVSGLHWLPTA